MRRTPQFIVNEEPWKGPFPIGPAPTPPPILFYQLLDEKLLPLMSTERLSTICREIRQPPPLTVFVVRRWVSPGRVDELYLSRQWRFWIDGEGRMRSQPIGRHWPTDD